MDWEKYFDHYLDRIYTVYMLKKSFAPVVDSFSKILILGSLPGDASLVRQEYYAYKYNVFWKIMGEILCFDSSLLSYNEKLKKLNQGRVALWDVVWQGTREGSMDNNICNIIPNDIPRLLSDYPGIECIFCNGGASYRFLKRYFAELFRQGFNIYQMPSTSPAAAKMRYEEKLDIYKIKMLSVLK